MFGVEDGVDAQAPAGDLQSRQNDGCHQTRLCAMDDAPRRVPVAYREIEGCGRRDKRKIEQEHRNNRQRQGYAVVESALVFQPFDLALFPSGFQTRRTKMLAVQFAIAQGA